jgi:hypothetical protein
MKTIIRLPSVTHVTDLRTGETFTATPVIVLRDSKGRVRSSKLTTKEGK